MSGVYELNVGQDVSLFAASADLSTKQFYFVTVNSSSQLALTVANANALGVLQDTPKSGVNGQVRVFGISKVQCGGTFNPGDLIASDANGKAVKYTAASVSAGTPEPLAGSSVLGQALTAGASGQLASIVLYHSGLNN